MTKLPTESRDYVALEGDDYPKYKVGPTCAVPGCSRLADNAHHVVRRSELGGAYSWVRMPDKVEIGNLTGLCFDHHNQVTENRAEIVYKNSLLYWEGPEGPTLPLTHQPPVKEQVTSYEEPEGLEVHEGREVQDIHTAPDHDPGVCPTCKRRLPKPKIDSEPEEARPRGTWAVAIPVDERENGADTLDALLEAAREELDKVGVSYGEGNKVKFYLLSTTLGLFVQHATSILSDD